MTAGDRALALQEAIASGEVVQDRIREVQRRMLRHVGPTARSAVPPDVERAVDSLCAIAATLATAIVDVTTTACHAQADLEAERRARYAPSRHHLPRVVWDDDGPVWSCTCDIAQGGLRLSTSSDVGAGMAAWEAHAREHQLLEGPPAPLVVPPSDGPQF